MRIEGPEKMYEFSKEFLNTIPKSGEKALIVALQGDLGAGKTTFVQGVARVLGVSEAVVSPTFVIERVYDIEHPSYDRLIHIDAYRLEDATELKALGWDEIIQNPRNLIFVEWPERLGSTLPAESITIQFSHAREGVRDVEIKS